MKGKRSAWVAGWILPVIMVLCMSCDDPDDTGLNVLPPEDLVNASFVDTFTVQARSFPQDSVLTDGSLYSLVGQYVDPEFGRIYASTWTQFHTSGDNIIFGSDPSKLSLDSLVLTLNIDGVYGRYDDPMTLEIFEIAGAFPADDTLYSNDSLAVSSLELAAGYTIDFSGQTDPGDELHIRLDDSLGRKLLLAPVDSLVNNATFQSFFKGLYIRAKKPGFNNREPGAIFAFDLLSTRTGLTLHYKDSTAVKSFTFDVDEDSRRFHNIRRSEYETKLFGIQTADSLNPFPPFMFIEAGAFVKLRVDLPYLENLAPAGINRADLVLYVDDQYIGSDERFDPPSRVFLYYADSTGRNEKGIAVSNADYDASTHSYSIPLTDNIMAVINGLRENTGFFIIPGNANVTLNRAVLGGPSSPSLAPKLKVVYTPIPE